MDGLDPPLLKQWFDSAGRTTLFRNAARPGVIRNVLKQACPSGSNIDDELGPPVQPTQRDGAPKPSWLHQLV